jgi:hypothetical protein
MKDIVRKRGNRKGEGLMLLEMELGAVVALIVLN